MSRIFITTAFIFFWAALFVTQTYHKLEMHHQLVESQWRQVEYQYHRCSEFVPSVCEVLEPVLEGETEVLQELRDAAASFRAVSVQNERSIASQRIEAALDRLYYTLGQFPSLRSDEEVLSILERLTVIEREIEVDSRRFEEQRRAFNDLVGATPCCYIASAFGFEEKRTISCKRAASLAQPSFSRMESWVQRHRVLDADLLSSGPVPTLKA